MRYQLGLGRDENRELLHQDLRNLAMELLAGTREHRPIGHLMRQGMLKGVPRLRHPGHFIEQLCGLQVPKTLLKRLDGKRRHGLEQGQWPLLANGRGNLYKASGLGGQSIEPCMILVHCRHAKQRPDKSLMHLLDSAAVLLHCLQGCREKHLPQAM